MPVLLKGPTGCGKTRFVEAMAHRLLAQREEPLLTISCHEDLSATDLVGRYLLDGDSTQWMDGPLTRAVRFGGLCYLDEVVEARKDTTVLIHSLTDHRRMLPIEKLGETLHAHDEFLLVISYNPGYQSALKDLKPSTRQRFVAIDFDYADEDKETQILVHEGGVDQATARELARLAGRVRSLADQGFEHGVSTRLLVYTAKLIAQGIAPRRACQVAIAAAITDDGDLQEAVDQLAATFFPET